MAEYVQRITEEMLPELELMESIGLFSSGEVRRILKKRKAFEYRLQRRSKMKSDFRQYIEYEVNVLKLIRKRRQKMRLFKGKTEIDFAIVHRIFQLYRTVCHRFQSDESLWLEYIDFCRSRKDSSTGSKVFSRMLQVHNNRPLLFVKAAKFELEDNNSMDNARHVLLQGIRFNKESYRLWQEYFRLELLNTDRWKRYVEELQKQYPDDENVQSQFLEMEEVNDAILDGKLAQIVFHNAMTDFGDKPDVVLGFFQISLKLPCASKIEEEIFDYLTQHHRKTEVYWGAQVMKIQTQVEQTMFKPPSIDRDIEVQALHNKMVTVFEEAIVDLPTMRMYDMYLSYEEEQLKRGSEVAQEKIKLDLTAVAERASNCECLSEDKGLVWLKLLEQLGDETKLRAASEKMTGLYPFSVHVWKQQVSLVTLLSPEANNEDDSAMQVFKQAVQHCRTEDSFPIWEVMYRWLKLRCPDRLEELFQMGEEAHTEITKLCRIWCLEVAAEQNGLKAVRRVYKKLHALPPYNLEFFNTYVQFEKTKVSPKKKIISIYEEMIRHFGEESADLWLDYMKTEKGDALLMGQIYDRAVRTLDPTLVEDFIMKSTLLYQS